MRFHGGSSNRLPGASLFKGELCFTLSEVLSREVHLPAISHSPGKSQGRQGWRYKLKEGVQELVHSSWAHSSDATVLYWVSTAGIPRVTLQPTLPNPDSSSGPSESFVLGRVPRAGHPDVHSSWLCLRCVWGILTSLRGL